MDSPCNETGLPLGRGLGWEFDCPQAEEITRECRLEESRTECASEIETKDCRLEKECSCRCRCERKRSCCCRCTCARREPRRIQRRERNNNRTEGRRCCRCRCSC